MENRSRPLARARALPGRLVLAGLAASVAFLPARAQATLTQNDVALAVYDSPDGVSWNALSATDLAGFFGPHRCACPDTISAQLQLTSAGQTDIGSSTVTVDFLLGQNCGASPTSCVSVGEVSFSATQSASSPTFSSALVFDSAAAGSTAVDCANLTAGSATLWAIIAQDGTQLGFVPNLALPVTTATVPAPTAVTAQPGNQGLLVSWTPPADTSLVAGYQVLCLPRPTVTASAGYESCGLDASAVGGSNLTPADQTEICSEEVSAGATSVHVTGLVNGTPYTVAVVAIDPGGGVSALSPPAVATPQPTSGFFEKYKQDGGAAVGCSVAHAPSSGLAGRTGFFWTVLMATLLLAPLGRRRDRRSRTGRKGKRSSKRGGKTGSAACALLLLLAWDATARAQGASFPADDDWTVERPAPALPSPPAWGFEIGLSLYRPAVDGEFDNGAHPFADTFSNSRHLMTEMELDRYLDHRFGTWGLGLRVGYYKVTAAAYPPDGVTRSGDETGLRLIPLSLSVLYRADGLPGLRDVPMIPYAKAGLDGVTWTATNSGGSATQTGFSPGWHAAAGIMLGLNALGNGVVTPGALADPCALFFEWDYAAINGLGLGNTLHVGDSTWFAGLMFDL